MPEPLAHAAKAHHQPLAIPAQQVFEGADARALQRVLTGLSDAPDHPHRPWPEKLLRLGLADHREAMRLVEIRGDLGEELVVAEADRAGHAQLVLHPLHEPRQHHRRWRTVQALGSGQVEKRLVERQRLDRRGQLFHEAADLFRRLGIERHARLQHHRVGAEVERLEHRHGRPHAADAGHVAGGRHDAAPATADDHRLVGELGVFAFLDAGIEGVAIHVGDREAAQLVMAHDPWPPAGGAAGAALEFGETVTTKRRHGWSIAAEWLSGDYKT